MRRKLPEMDKAMATLLQDLSDRGLLDSTIVWWSGEFGRTPKVRWEAALERRTRTTGAKSSRPWWPAADSRAATSSARPTPRANRSKSGPSIPCDLIGSMYELLGIDSGASLLHPLGQMARVTPAPEDKIPSAGRLKEIM